MIADQLQEIDELRAKVLLDAQNTVNHRDTGHLVDALVKLHSHEIALYDESALGDIGDTEFDTADLME
jgi:hypothetical protein